jgi:hypothetical protein
LRLAAKWPDAFDEARMIEGVVALAKKSRIFAPIWVSEECPKILIFGYRRL